MCVLHSTERGAEVYNYPMDKVFRQSLMFKTHTGFALYEVYKILGQDFKDDLHYYSVGV